MLIGRKGSQCMAWQLWVGLGAAHVLRLWFSAVRRRRQIYFVVSASQSQLTHGWRSTDTMPPLAIIPGCGGNDRTKPLVNFIVVPGVAGVSLSDKTCPHFGRWLATLITKCRSRAQSWVYDNDIQLDKLESWDKYSSNGCDLLQQLLAMQRKPEFPEDSTFVLVGHKLGCYILKKALIEAFDRSHRTDPRALLDMVETVIMVGEPKLDPKKRDKWINSISECVSAKKTLPKKLANGHTVGCLQRIADRFEDSSFLSNMVEVSGTSKPRPKIFNFKKAIHDGCVCPETIHVRMWTAASEGELLEKGLGDGTLCGFHPESPDYGNLLRLNSSSILSISAPENMDNTTASVQPEALFPGHVLDEAGTKGQDSETGVGQYKGEQVKSNQASEFLDRFDSCSSEGQNSRFESVRDDELHPEAEDTATVGSANISYHTQQFINNLTDHCTTESATNPIPNYSSTNPGGRKLHFSTSIPGRDRLFTGRITILEQLMAISSGLATNAASQELHTNKPKIVWLQGPSGIGKTSIAVEFAYQRMDGFTHVIWLNATSKATLGTYCHDFAVALGLVNGRTCQNHEVSRREVISWLETSQTQWLLIIDNVTGSDIIAPYIPRSQKGLIIATSVLTAPALSVLRKRRSIRRPSLMPLGGVRVIQLFYES
ncbi:hypothetical protein JX266_010332 [Neoarthrinium moseri]|nr:hypothetical protein JX266_010332 [Neoarthrinium moseri]